jgi:hypothetical protein
MPRAITSVGLASAELGLAPLEEFTSVEAWLRALPSAIVLRIGLEDGSSYLTSVGHILDSARLGDVVERFRIQMRLASLHRGAE